MQSSTVKLNKNKFFSKRKWPEIAGIFFEVSFRRFCENNISFHIIKDSKNNISFFIQKIHLVTFWKEHGYISDVTSGRLH